MYRDGKLPSERTRLTIFVIGRTKTSRQDFSNFVGIGSSGHVASEEDRMICLISSVVANLKLSKDGGTVGGHE